MIDKALFPEIQKLKIIKIPDNSKIGNLISHLLTEDLLNYAIYSLIT